MFKTRRKLLSQNFLKDNELVKQLIRSSGILWNDIVLEIGAGPGVITKNLLSVSKKVIAVEIDKNLFSLLSSRLGNNPSLKTVCGNFLDVELPKEPYKVFSNIPFSITGEIIKKLLFSDNPPDSCSFVIQKEAAEKFMVNKKKNSMLSILFYPWFEFKVVHAFRRTDFVPVPSVDMCLLQITKRRTMFVSSADLCKYRDFIVFKFTKSREVGNWPPTKWLVSYTKDTHSRGYFAKWQKQQEKIQKIHRTRTDRNWVKYRR